MQLKRMKEMTMLCLALRFQSNRDQGEKKKGGDVLEDKIYVMFDNCGKYMCLTNLNTSIIAKVSRTGH